ncbi:hypothetical protein AMAG_01516 [Allomyces macrogynus ATCC 38327]|uniref:Uncharacterized protein n=1 Tax=Allomyces macrogynus (strain ATCC 38327) TaxID=578462 RepID=A0A0L0RZY6_ALLM3|nr:hypothetical protein AMAG_01516 [Allomyces macrogynus ATCC 38327]|eukprot:KNE55629.1 hypothetical protein AMAG_01516 [Allomyces macrogynus ATCC 38327]
MSPRAPKLSIHVPRNPPSSPHGSPTTPTTPRTPRTPKTSRTLKTPTTPMTLKTPTQPRTPTVPRTPRTPTTPRSLSEPDIRIAALRVLGKMTLPSVVVVDPRMKSAILDNSAELALRPLAPTDTNALAQIVKTWRSGRGTVTAWTRYKYWLELGAVVTWTALTLPIVMLFKWTVWGAGSRRGSTASKEEQDAARRPVGEPAVAA